MLLISHMWTRWRLSSAWSGLKVASCPAGAGRPSTCAPVAFLIAAAAGGRTRGGWVQRMPFMFATAGGFLVWQGVAGAGAGTAWSVFSPTVGVVAGPVIHAR